VKLATLPRYVWHDGFACGLESFVCVADDKFHSVHATFLQRLEKITPVNFGFRQRHTDTEDRSMSAGQDSDSDQNGTVTHASVDTDLFVACIEDQIFDLSDGSLSPDFQFFIEESCGPADLHAGDFQSTKFSSNFCNLTSRNSLDVHFRDSQFECSFAPFSSLQCRRVEFTVTRLRHTEFEFPESCADGFILEAVGVRFAFLSPLVRLGIEVLGPFHFHCFVEEDLHGVGHSFKAVLGQQLDSRVEFVRLNLARSFKRIRKDGASSVSLATLVTLPNRAAAV